MPKDQIMALIERKIKDAIETAEMDSCKHNDAWNHYYYGVAEGLRQAKSIVGMIDKRNKVSRGIK
jgi:hypothetical protein